MPKCAIKSCKNYVGREETPLSVTYHRLPSDQVIRNKWIKVIRESRDDAFWKPVGSSLVCSEHFVEGDFYYCGEEKKKRLQKTAVPSRNVSNVENTSYSENPIKEEDDDYSGVEDVSLADGEKVVIKIESVKKEPKKKKKFLKMRERKKKIKEDLEELNSDDEVYLNLDSVYNYLLPPAEARLRNELIQKAKVNKRQTTKIQNLKRQHVKLEKKIRVLQKIIATLQNDTTLVLPKKIENVT